MVKKENYDNELGLYDSLDIRETIDGVSVNDLPSPSAGRRTGTRTAGSTERKVSPTAAPVSEKEEAAKRKALMKKKGRPDPYIWGIYIMLLVISVIELFSASSTEVSGSNVYGPLIRHGIFLLLGLGIVLWLQRTPYTLFNKFAWLFAILSLGLLLASSMFGVEINGAQRAISVAGMTIQPAEIVKLTVVCLLASILGKNQTPGGVTMSGIITSAVVVVVFGACMWKNGLTNMLLLMCVSICMMLIGGIQWKRFGAVLGVYLICGAGIMFVKHITPDSNAYDEVTARQQLIAQADGEAVVIERGGKKIDRGETRNNRIIRFMKGVHPEDPIDDMNRQVIFANFAQANGGMFGQGPGNSRESARLPLAFSDYIYSIIVEDTGFVGGAAILLLYLLLVARAGRIAYKCSRAFPAFLILGCAVMIVFQALVHMAIVTGLFPVSGQPLPFISKGGTSILVMSAAIGIMLSVSRFAAHSGDKKHIRAEINALPEEMQAANFSNAGQ